MSAVFAFFLFSTVMSADAIAEVVLADGGESFYPVVITQGASSDVEKAADDLAQYLGEISGAVFEVVRGHGDSGIVVGNHIDFPGLGFEEKFDPNDLMRRDEYVIQSHGDGLYLIGATDLATQHAVWDLLYRLGHRQFIPTDNWEIIPDKETLSVELDVFESPDFVVRRGPRGAAWSDGELWEQWMDRNRLTSDFTLRTTHSYGGIIRANQEAFDENPEFYAKIDGKREWVGGNSKFCISNDDLRELVVNHAVGVIEETPERDSISMDPSDGGNWCECEGCEAMGSVSDQVVTLANEVAEAVNSLDHGDKYVGIYAYAAYSPPPNVDVHPKVIVSTATAFLRGGFTKEELIEGWSERANMLGLRDYYGTHVWWRAMPRRSRGSNVNYLVEYLPYYYREGIRFMNACGADSWGADGLGYYLSGRILWDTAEAERADDIIEDFLEKCFADAKEPMRDFYYLLSQDHDTVRTNDDVLARMFGYLDEARKMTDDPAVIERLDELILYTRYVELKYKFNDAGGEDAREAAAQELFRHAYRMRDTMMIHIQALYRWLRRRGIDMPEEADPGRLSVGSEGKDFAPWTSSEAFSEEEIGGFLEAGLDNYEKMVVPFEPVSFSDELVPAADALDLPEVTTGDFGRGDSFRGSFSMYTWFDEAGDKGLPLEVSAGHTWQDRGDVQFELHSPQEPLVEPVDTASVPPDEETHEIVLASPYDGLHELRWSDGGGTTKINFPEDHPMTIRSSMDAPAGLRGNRFLYFYVPKGTEMVGGYTTHERTRILDGAGNRLLDWGDVEGGEGYFDIPVPEGQDGTLWKLERGYGQQMLMTVPPYFARNERELLLPREVVEADSEKSSLH